MGNRRLAVILASFFTVLIGFTIRNSYGVLLPEMLPSLKISKKEAGLIYGSFFMAYTIFSPLLGLLADRVNLRALLTLFLGILGIGTLLMGYSSTLLEAMVFFLLAGIGSSACWSPVVPLVQRWTSDQRRGMILALVDAGSSVGIAISSVMMPIIVGAFDWRMGWKSLGVMAFFLAGINFLLVRDSPVENPSLPHSKFNQPLNQPAGTLYLNILKDKKFLLIGVSYLLIGFSTLIPLTFIATYAVQELMFRYDAAARLVTVFAITSIFGKIALGILSDRLGRIQTIVLCEALVVLGCFGMFALPGFWALYLSMVVFGFGFGAIWPLFALCAPDYFSQRNAGFIVGFWTLFLGVGLVISPIIAGWIADGTGRFMWSFMLAMVTAMISIFLLLLVRRKISLPKGGNTSRPTFLMNVLEEFLPNKHPVSSEL
ncbi:MAG: MFS transporter [Syntrophaceae bacterium]|nr:MFS transporter [Syntrophaceae bacterium]